MPALGPGMKASFAEQYSVSPAKTHGLAVGLGGIFFGRTARRRLRSLTAIRLTRFRVPCHNVQNFVAARVRHIQDGLMQEVRNIADLLGRESKARHPLLRAALD